MGRLPFGAISLVRTVVRLLGPPLNVSATCHHSSATELSPQPSRLILLLYTLSIDLIFRDISQRFINESMDQCTFGSHAANSSVHQTLDEMDFERGIWTSAMSGDIDKVKKHLNKGTNPDSEDKAGYTALHYAARCGHPHICAILIEAGATVDKKTKAGGATALHRAALAGHLEICRILTHYGANALAKDVDGRTPLHRAVEEGHEKIISFFLEQVPSAALEKDNQGKTPFDNAKERTNLTSLFTSNQNNKK